MRRDESWLSDLWTTATKSCAASPRRNGNLGAGVSPAVGEMFPLLLASLFGNFCFGMVFMSKDLFLLHVQPPRPHKYAASPPIDPKEQRKLDSRVEDFRPDQAALSGSDRRTKKLMHKYHDAIFNFIFKMVHDRQQVEDLTQEAFIKAFSVRSEFQR